MNMHIGQNGNGNVPAQNGGQGSETSQETERLKKQLEERKRSIETRLTNSNKTISSTEDEINQLESKTLVGIFSRMSGQKGVLEEQLKDEKRFRGKLEIERVEFNKTSEKVEKLLQEGKVEEARAVLDGREAEYKEKIKSATSRLAVNYKQTKEDLKDVDKFLANREQDIEKAHNRLVVLASLVTMGKGGGFVSTAIKATAAGFSVGGVSNLAEGVSNTFEYGNSGKESFKNASVKTGKDAWTSFKIGAAGGLGKVLGGLKSLSALSNITKAFIAGSAVSAATNITDTTVGTISGEDTRTWTQKGVDFFKDTIIGGISSMLGLKGEQFQQGKSAFKSVVIRGTTDVVAPTALNYAGGNVANKATGRETQTADQVLDSTLDTTTSTLIGAYSNTKSLSNKAESKNSQSTTPVPPPQNSREKQIPPTPQTNTENTSTQSKPAMPEHEQTANVQHSVEVSTDKDNKVQNRTEPVSDTRIKPPALANGNSPATHDSEKHFVSGNGSVGVGVREGGIYEPSQRPQAQDGGTRFETGVEITFKTNGKEKKLPLLIDKTVGNSDGSVTSHEAMSQQRIQELANNGWKSLSDGLFATNGVNGKRDVSGGLDHLIDIHTRPIIDIDHLIAKNDDGSHRVQPANQFPHQLNRNQMVELISQALQNPDRVVMSNKYGKEDVLNIYCALPKDNKLAPGISEVRITYNPESGVCTFTPNKGDFITVVPALKNGEGPVLSGTKPTPLTPEELKPENRDKLIIVYTDNKGRYLKPEHPKSSGPTPLNGN